MKIVNQRLRKEYAQSGHCELCNLSCAKREGHHLRAKGMGGNGVLDVRINLIGLGAQMELPDGRTHFTCPCHRLIHAGRIMPMRCLEIVASREKVRIEEVTAVMDLFRRLVKPTPAELERGLNELTPLARALAERELREAEEAKARRLTRRRRLTQ